LAEDGRKMSKSLKNYPDLEPTLDTYGADALRYMLSASPATHAEEVRFSETALDEVNKKVFNRLENVYSFYNLYSNDCPDCAVSVPESNHVLDRWILARLNETQTAIEKNLDAFVIDKATRSIGDFVDDLSTWYLRRSRDRFKSDDQKDKILAIQTTQYVLTCLAKIIAPVVPVVAEHLYLRVRNKNIDNAESVHLVDWPEAKNVDQELINGMIQTRKVIESGLALRSKAGIKARQPLQSFTYPAPEFNLSPELEEIVLDEMNVKEIKQGPEIELDTHLTPDLVLEGVKRDILRSVQDQRKERNLNPGEPISLEVYTTNREMTEKVFIGFSELTKKASVSHITFIGCKSNDTVFEKEKFEIAPDVFVACHIISTTQKHM
jgi:isoleucyl-tRNA synthetase